MFLREQANKLYNFIPYFFANSAIQIPTTTILPVITLCITYWGCGFRRNNPIEFLQIYLILAILANCAVSMGLFISALIGQPEAATAASSLITLPSILFGGLYANSATIPVYFDWIQYLSPIRYANEAICQAQWKDVNLETEALLDRLGFDLGYTKCIILLAIITVVWRLGALIALRCKITRF